jgi:hypothetical protein
MHILSGEAVIERRRMLRYFSLFVFLVFVYAVGLSRYLNFVSADGKAGGPIINTPLDLMPPIVWFCILSALPFASLACYDKNWRSSEAAPVCVAAWAVVAVSFMVKLHTNCLLLVAFPFPAFIASAAAAHTAGRATRLYSTRRGSMRDMAMYQQLGRN